MRALREAARRGLRALGPAGRVLLGSATFVAMPALSWAASFKQVPGASEDGGAGGAGGDDPDMILGLIHMNTLFFIVLGVFCVFWFLFGGGRKANIGRKGH